MHLLKYLGILCEYCNRPCKAIAFHTCVGVAFVSDHVCVRPCEWVVRDTAWTLPLAVYCIGPLLVVDGVAGEVVAVHAVDAMMKS